VPNAQQSVNAGAETARGGFAGFGPQCLSFFKALAFHQSKEWFVENKAIYETEVKAPLVRLIASLSEEFSRRGVPLAGVGEKSIFRIHRDIRFSKDKNPYKTHAGATLTRDGAKMSQGLFYIHIAPEGSFAAAGFYQPDTAALAALRSAIAHRPERWARLEERLASAGLFLSQDDKLSRLPKGFDPNKNASVAETLKLKSFIVRRAIEQETLFKPALLMDLANFGEAALPLLDFGWAVIDRAAKSRAE
jgi:uncharacterized protein (TIGR02453 family)